jgi:small subunit ribosomal protein S21
MKQGLLMQVNVRKNNVVKAMNLLNKKLKEEGDVMRLRERMTYEKPSAKRRRLAKAGRKRFLKSLASRVDGEFSSDRRPSKRKPKKKAWEARVRKDAK